MKRRDRPSNTVGGVEFCEFDQRLLARAIDVHEGSLEGVAGELRAVRLRSWRSHRQMDLLLTQLADLRERLARVRAPPSDLLQGRPIGAYLRGGSLRSTIHPDEITNAMWARNGYLGLVRRALDPPWARLGDARGAELARTWSSLAMEPPEHWYDAYAAVRGAVESALRASSTETERFVIRRAEVAAYAHATWLDRKAHDDFESAFARYTKTDFRTAGIDPAAYWEDLLTLAIAFLHLRDADLFDGARPDDVERIDPIFVRLQGELERDRNPFDLANWTDAYADFVQKLNLRDRFLDVARIPHVSLCDAVRLAEIVLDDGEMQLAQAIIDARTPRRGDFDDDVQEFQGAKRMILEAIRLGRLPWDDEEQTPSAD